MNYNICIVRPTGYTHSAAFTELAELVAYSLQELGHSVAINFNQVYSDIVNIIIGCHLLDPSHLQQMPQSSIVINTEQIFSDKVPWNSDIFSWALKYETWDYSTRNIEKFREIGATNVKFLGIGFHSKLARIRKLEIQDIDILFYGSMNRKRRNIINQLKEAGCNVRAEFGLYGEERDELIARSKVVLNLHYYNSEIFEIVRVFYLMTNSKAVVGEVNKTTSVDPRYLEGIFPSSYERLVDSCIELVKDDKLRSELEIKALSAIKKLPQREFIAALIRS